MADNQDRTSASEIKEYINLQSKIRSISACYHDVAYHAIDIACLEEPIW